MRSQECQCCGLKVPSRLDLHAISPPVKFVQKMLRRYKRWVAIKESCRQLQKMDERMLKDIGISRADVVRLTTYDGLWKHMRDSGEPDPKPYA